MAVEKVSYIELDQIYHPDTCNPLVKAYEEGRINFAALKRLNYPGEKLPENVLCGVNSLGFWDAKVKQDWGLDWHRNEGIEFTFLASGLLDFSLTNQEFCLKPGELTITRPWQPHKVGNPFVEPNKLYWLIIDVGVRQPHQEWQWPDWIVLAQEDLAKLTKILRQNEKPVWLADEKIYKCFYKIGVCLEQSKEKIPHSKLVLLINELLLLLLLDLFILSKEKVSLDDTLTQNLRTADIFFQFLKSNYSHPWTLDSMAVHCGLGITTLTKYCRQLTNLSPINYLNRTRLESAAEMLKSNGDKNISDICYGCGFSSTQYFATSFKKLYKCTPKDYRSKFCDAQNISY